MNPNLNSTKFQLSTLAAVIALVSPFVADVPPVIALCAIVVIVVAYGILNVLDKSM